MKDSLGTVFFTEYDDKITGTSQRDPLGLQPIWSFYGRNIVKHLTTVSTDIRGFRETLLCLSICGDYKTNIKSEHSLRELILIFEQIFIYTVIDKSKQDDSIGTEGIIGADNGKSKFETNRRNPAISASDTILVNEISLGYYGRYKTPLSTMKVIDKYSNVIADIDVTKLYGNNIYKKIYTAFCNFIKLKSSERKFREFKSKAELYEAVCGNFREGEKDFWLNKLQIEGKEKDELMSSCYNLLGTNSYESVIDKMSNLIEAQEIELLEPFLRCLESVFNKALMARKLDDKIISQDEIEEHKKRYNEFLKLSEFKGNKFTILEKRLNFIKTNCSPESENYIRSVIEYHAEVCKQKKSSVWAEVDNSGNIQTFVEPDGNINIDVWGRNYYLSSLLSIKDGIEELSYE